MVYYSTSTHSDPGVDVGFNHVDSRNRITLVGTPNVVFDDAFDLVYDHRTSKRRQPRMIPAALQFDHAIFRYAAAV
jgi:hypothetical protein